MLKDARIIAKKEIKLLFKSPRRILLLLMTPGIILLVAIPSLFLYTISDKSAPGPLNVVIIQDDTGYGGYHWGEYFYGMLKEYNGTKDFNYVNKSVTELDKLREASNLSVLMYIPDNFSELIDRSNVILYPEPALFHLYYNSENNANLKAVTNITTVAYQLNLILVYMENGPVKLTRVTTAFTDIAGGQLESFLTGYLTMIPLYAIFLLVIPSLTLVLISVTIEREQKTLESLLLQPLDRKSIIGGKLLYGMLLVTFNISSLFLTLFVILIAVLIILPADLRNQAGDLVTVLLDSADITIWLFVFYLIIGLVLMSVLLVASAVLFSMLAKDEREANMVVSSFILIPLLGVTFMGFIPLNKLPEAIQVLLVILPLLGYMFGIYMAILTGEVTIITWFTLIFQAVWIGVVIWFAGRVIETEGILDVSMKRLLLNWRKKK